MFKKKESKEKEQVAEPKAKPAAVDAIIETLPDGCVIMDLEGKILQVNNAAMEMFGYSEEDLLGNNVINFVYEEDIPRIAKELKNGMEKGGTVVKNFECTGVTKDGKKIPICVNEAFLKDEKGKQTDRSVLVIRDVTELKRAEEERARALAEAASAKRAADIIEAMPIGVVTMDLNGTILDGNEASDKMFRLEKHEGVGRAITDYIVGEDVPRALEAIQECIEKGYYRGFETTGVRKDGSRFPIIIDGTLLKDAEGNPTSIVIAYRDITELKRAEEKRIEAEKKAARAEEAEKYSRELEAKIRDLERFQKVTMDREKRVLELKKEIKELKKQLEVK